MPITIETFDAKWVEDKNGCWIWSGKPRNECGYGRIQVDGKAHAAHRISWELRVGPIPEGLVIDHLCHVTMCVRPDHLRVTTQAENLKARRPFVRIYTRVTHCKYGHEYTPKNTYERVQDGYLKRFCRACRRKGGRV